MEPDKSLDALLDLDGQVLVVDSETNHWALSLHGPNGERLVGFDNAHSVRERAGPSGNRRRAAQDHRHRLKTVRP